MKNRIFVFLSFLIFSCSEEVEPQYSITSKWTARIHTEAEGTKWFYDNHEFTFNSDSSGRYIGRHLRMQGQVLSGIWEYDVEFNYQRDGNVVIAQTGPNTADAYENDLLNPFTMYIDGFMDESNMKVYFLENENRLSTDKTVFTKIN